MDPAMLAMIKDAKNATNDFSTFAENLAKALQKIAEIFGRFATWDDSRKNDNVIAKNTAEAFGSKK